MSYAECQETESPLPVSTNISPRPFSASTSPLPLSANASPLPLSANTSPRPLSANTSPLPLSANTRPFVIPPRPSEPAPLPPEYFGSPVAEEDTLQNATIDELIGLAPEEPKKEKESFLQKMGSSLVRMKDQTTSTFTRLLHPSAQTDLLGLEESEAVSQPTPEVFDTDMNLVPAGGDMDVLDLVSFDSIPTEEDG